MPFDGSQFEMPRHRPWASPLARKGPGLATWIISFAAVVIPFMSAAFYVCLR